MAESFTYDLISLLRVLYRKRSFIIRGTIFLTIVTALAAIFWPETWRADARILVSTPKFKETLQLVPQPFDVLTYQGIMSSDDIYLDIISTLKWLSQSIHELLIPPKVDRLKQNLAEKANTLTLYQLIENTNLRLLSELLIPSGQKIDERWKLRISLLSQMNSEEIENLYNLSPAKLEKMTVFQLHKNLKTKVEKVKETNVETLYSRLIELSADTDTAVGARMLANLWVDLFLDKAEKMVREEVQRQILFTKQQVASVEMALASEELKLMQTKDSGILDTLRSEVASKLILLTGVTEIRQWENRKQEKFDLKNQNEPFLREQWEQFDTLTFDVTSQYERALIPQRFPMQREIEVLTQLLKTEQNPEKISTYKTDLEKSQNQLNLVDNQIQSLTKDIRNLQKQIRDGENQTAALERKVQQLQSSLATLQPFFSEAQLLENKMETTRYADLSADRAIKPDKRIFPRRSIMTLIGAGIALVLFCGLAFLQDIWVEVTKPE